MNSIFWAILILFLVAAFMRMDWVYYPIYVVGGLWLFSHWWVRRSLKNISVRRKLPQHAFPGEVLHASIQLTNHSRLPLPWLHIQERVAFELQDVDHYRTVLSVGGNSTAIYQYKLHCSKRGYHSVGPFALTTGDLFGFVSTAWQESESSHVIVYPQVVSLEKLGLPSRSPFGTIRSRQRIFEDPARVAGVRAYAAGDSFRSIHWKASARDDALLVKKLEPAIALNVTIVLDLNQSAYPLSGAVGSSEWAISIAASIASHLASTQRQQVGLICNGLDPLEGAVTHPISPRSGRGQLMNILNLLARVEMHEFEATLAEWLPRALTHLEWGTTLIVVAPDLDEQALWALHNAYRRGSSVIALLCAPDANFRTRQAQGKRLGLTLHRTGWEKDLRTVTQSRP